MKREISPIAMAVLVAVVVAIAVVIGLRFLNQGSEARRGGAFDPTASSGRAAPGGGGAPGGRGAANGGPKTDVP